MAVSSSRGGGGGRIEFLHHQVPKKFKDAETSPERTKIWSEHKPKTEIRKVPVVYYLSRDGHLEHPHFMEVPISSQNEGLYLRDVINRLNSLRGKGMASMYSWSSKRSYKNGFVWHDLSENDFIYPVHGQEYVLKGSELLLSGSASFKSEETMSSSSEKQQQHATSNSSEESEFPVIVRRRNQSWSSVDLHEYKVYKTESSGENAEKAADASTQTDEKRRRRRAPIREEEHEDDEHHHKIDEQQQQQCENHTTELSRDEISPPPSSSPETLESLIKADGRRIVRIVDGADVRDQSTANNYPSGRMKASTVLMQLISCGSLSMKGSGGVPTSGKDLGLSLVSHYKARLPRGAPNQVQKEALEGLMEKENPSFEGIQVEGKEYFSGSLIETRKDEFPALKRSSSYNADRSSKMELKEKEIDGVRAKCIPRMPKPSAVRKEGQ